MLDGFAGGALLGAFPTGPIQKIFTAIVALGQDLTSFYEPEKDPHLDAADFEIALGDAAFQLLVAYHVGARNEALDSKFEAVIKNQGTTKLVVDTLRALGPQILGGAIKTELGDGTRRKPGG